MNSILKLGLLREGKQPPDSRVVLPPELAAAAMAAYPGLEITVQPSAGRCFDDDEYRRAGLTLAEDLMDCDILLGVKEVPVGLLLEGKTYFMFSHTIKKQPYNQKLLARAVNGNIRLIDYECLTDEKGIRVIAFGRWAGIVGAHNGLYMWGRRTGAYDLPRANACRDYADLLRRYENITFPPVRIVTTGGGRVAHGAMELLRNAGIRQVGAEEFLTDSYDEAVFTNLDCDRLYRRHDSDAFDFQDFFRSPAAYRSVFRPYAEKTDLFINSIYWDPAAPAFFSKEEMNDPGFTIQAIADITCDIAPAASVPSTIRASTIENPVYGYDTETQRETAPFQPESVDVMAVDNLPNELPRDASEAFGSQFLEFVLPELLNNNGENDFIKRGTITRAGDLTAEFEYLRDYLEGR